LFPTVAVFLILTVAAGDAFSHVMAPDTVLSEALHHPAFDPVHAVAFAAAGLWAGQQDDRRGWILLCVLCLGVVAGIALAKINWLPPGRSQSVFLGITVLGIAIAARWRPHLAIGIVLVATVGVLQGIIGALPEFKGGTGHHSAADVVVAAGILSILAQELSRRATPAWAGIVIRVAGSWIAAAAILLAAFTVRLQFGLGVSS